MVFLNLDELKALACVKPDGECAAEVRRAFLFSCYTGLRIIDLETLAWGMITSNPIQIMKIQEKTKRTVYIP
jgi:integrase